MVKPLSFKGDKKPKKRKHAKLEDDEDQSAALTSTSQTPANDAAAEDDSWVSAEAATDLAGPTIVALPTTPATCLACDANGSVFSSPIENIAEGDSATAEPHDVRQVWVANRVAGTEWISFKGHHGKYLGADKFGILTATREAISPEEQFLCIPSTSTPGMFDIQTQRDTFISTTNSSSSTTAEIRADTESISFTTTVRIRMQARFKPRLKANKESKAREKISRKQLEETVGRRLDDDEVRRLKRARRDGTYHEAVLDVRVKGKHDKFAS